MKTKYILILLTLITTLLLGACGIGGKDNNQETTDNRKFTQEIISELERDSNEFSVMIGIESMYNLESGDFVVTEGKLVDDYTYAVYGTIKIRNNQGKIQQKNIVVTYQVEEGRPIMSNITLK